MPVTITRRSVVGMMGAGGLVGALSTQVGSVPTPSLAEGSAMPLQAGARFGRWTVSAVHPIEDGALHVDVRDAEQREFVLEVLARDTSPLATRPPAMTEGLAIYVRNGGDGWHPTAEEQGLAAMALAELLAASGRGGTIAGLLSHTDRVLVHGEMLRAAELAPGKRMA